MSTVIKEFSRFAHQYDKHNEIQVRVAKRLVDKLQNKHYSTILDMGSGSGEVCRNMMHKHITFDEFTAFDSSENMLSLHPENTNIKKICGNFNEEGFSKILEQNTYELILSSSALQWSKNLDFTLSSIASLSKTLYSAIFTSNTFKTLHTTAGIESPIYSAEEVKKSIRKYYSQVNFELHQYTLYFDSTREMFRYIKKSGVSSGEKKLSFKEIKRLMKIYPLKYLEFEVLFVEAKNM